MINWHERDDIVLSTNQPTLTLEQRLNLRILKLTNLVDEMVEEMEPTPLRDRAVQTVKGVRDAQAADMPQFGMRSRPVYGP